MQFVGPAVVGAVVGPAVVFGVVSAVPGALHLLGFTKTGIAAGSLAARMMSLSAIANGGRVATGSLVALAQSLGMTGLPISVWAALLTTGAAIGSVIGSVIETATGSVIGTATRALLL